MSFDKLKYVFWVVLGVGAFLLFLTILMPLFSSLTTDAAAEVAASSYNATYVGTVEALNYTPLGLYIIVPILGLGLIVWRLRKP